MRRCGIGGCTKLHWAGDLCLEHFVAHHHDVTQESALAIRAASGTPWAIARAYRARVYTVWEIRHGS